MIAPRLCMTAAGLVIYNQQVLLVKHTKLNIWLAPGGHIDEHELAHKAALREVKEETGIDAVIHSAVPMPANHDSEYLPVPLLANLHWVARENYEARCQSEDQTLPHKTKLWPRGCEQHMVWLYLMTPLDPNQSATRNERESTQIGWFGSDQVQSLETTDDIRAEMLFALDYAATHLSASN